ncbi:MAG: LCP family protein [Anaerolineae bacterium]|nr:LCP family protein [Anaerolineae bacterium]
MITSVAGCTLVWIVFIGLTLSTYGLSGVAYADATFPPTGSAPTGSSPTGSSPTGSSPDATALPASTPVPGHIPSPTTWPATFTPTFVPTLTPTPTPTPNALGVSPLPLGPDVRVIALLGIDEKQGASVWRTDSIILAFMQPERKKVALISIPRDLWVYVPGHGYDRLNTVDALGVRSGHTGGGRGLLNDTLRYNLGVPVHQYVRIDFEGFVDIVDALGGVDVYVEKPMSPDGFVWISLPVGWQHLDGQTTLSYCRSRMTTSDFDRSHRQQQVVKALWKKALTAETIARAPRLWEAFEGSFETDISMVEAIALATAFQGLDPENVQSVNLGFDTARPWTTPQGAQVLLPNVQAIQQIVIKLLEE